MAVITSNAPSVTKQHSLTLNFNANDYVGCGENTIILADREKSKLVKYTLDSISYNKKWTKPLPKDVQVNSAKYVSPSLFISRYYNNDPTLTFNHDLQPQDTFSDQYGSLCGILPNDRLLYAKKISGDHYELSLYQLPSHKLETTLTRPGKPFKWDRISVSSDASTHRLAVVDGGGCGSQSLDVYDASLQHVRHVDLPYEPRGVTGVAVIKHWVIIVDHHDKSLRVYNWGGEEVGRMSNQDLGLDGAFIWGIGLAGDSGLHIVAGHVESVFHVVK